MSELTPRHRVAIVRQKILQLEAACFEFELEKEIIDAQIGATDEALAKIDENLANAQRALDKLQARLLILEGESDVDVPRAPAKERR